MKGGEGVKGVKEIPTQLRKMAKCMIYIGSYACGECYGNSFTPFTPSPRRSRPLGGSVINGTIQQLLDTHHGHPTGQFVHPQVGGVPNSATQPRNVASLPDIREDAARAPQRLVRAGAGDVSGAVPEKPRGASCWEFRKRGAAALFAG